MFCLFMVESHVDERSKSPRKHQQVAECPAKPKDGSVENVFGRVADGKPRKSERKNDDANGEPLDSIKTTAVSNTRSGKDQRKEPDDIESIVRPTVGREQLEDKCRQEQSKPHGQRFAESGCPPAQRVGCYKKNRLSDGKDH